MSICLCVAKDLGNRCTDIIILYSKGPWEIYNYLEKLSNILIEIIPGKNASKIFVYLFYVKSLWVGENKYLT